jgi:hypothetical protein
MTAEELERALEHCHSALGDTLMVISEMLEQKGDPDTIVTRIERAQAKYNAITKLLRGEGT